MKIHFKTFGCKINQCETSYMQNKVLDSGDLTSNFIGSDAIVINSCTVTSKADNKTKQYLRKCIRLNSKAKIYMTGCYVERAKKSLEYEFPGVKCFKNSDKKNILNILGLNKVKKKFNSVSNLNNRTRVFVKIQDGCDGKCSYCIVPKVRTVMFSRDIADITKEIKYYLSLDYKEIVLCGIRLGKYGIGNKESKKIKGLTNLIKELETLKGYFRIRLSSIEILDISDEIIGLIKKSNKLCHHLHIPLQSGDNEILKSMRRPYTKEIFLDKIQKIRKEIPDIGITTDVIIGYPFDNGDTLRNTYNFINKCQFSRIHIFRYSKRPGTESALLDKVCDNSLIDKWIKKCSKLDMHLRRAFALKFSGKKLDVLKESNGYGYTSNYIYLKLPDAVLPNEITYLTMNKADLAAVC